MNDLGKKIGLKINNKNNEDNEDQAKNEGAVTIRQREELEKWGNSHT